MPVALHETKHYQATQALRGIISRLKPGELLPVVTDLNGRLGASQGTTMRALSVLAKEGLIHRPLGKQRYQATPRRAAATMRVLFVRPDYPSAAYDALGDRVYARTRDKRWGFEYLSLKQGDAWDLTERLRNVDAAVFYPSSEELSPEFVETLLRSPAPVVTVVQHVDHPDALSVVTDDHRVGVLAAETLWDRGHRRVMVLRDQPHETTMRERLRGFSERAAELGLELREEDILHSPVRPFESAKRVAYEMMRDYFSRKKPAATALFSLASEGAIATMRAAHEHGMSVPGDLAVLCFCGSRESVAPYLTPSLSVVTFDHDAMVGAIIEQVESATRPGSPRTGRKITLEPYMILRESC